MSFPPKGFNARNPSRSWYRVNPRKRMNTSFSDDTSCTSDTTFYTAKQSFANSSTATPSSQKTSVFDDNDQEEDFIEPNSYFPEGGSLIPDYGTYVNTLKPRLLPPKARPQIAKFLNQPAIVQDEESFKKFRQQNKDIQALREVINARPGAVYNLQHIYQWYDIPRPANKKKDDEDILFIRTMWKHHYDNPGMYDTVGALRHFRRIMEQNHNPEEVLENFKFYNFLRPMVPTKFDKPDFTGPYIAGALSEELEDLYERYGVKEGEWKQFLEIILTEDVPLYDKELAKFILDKIKEREKQFQNYRGDEERRVGTTNNLYAEPEDIPTLDKMYRRFYGKNWTGNLNDRMKKQFVSHDGKFFLALRKFRQTNPGPIDTLRAFRFYRKMIAPDPSYFKNPKFYHFENFKIIDPSKVKEFPSDFTGPLLAGPYTHELQEIYDRYQVKPGEWKKFLEYLQNDPKALIFDQELAKYVLDKIKELNENLQQREEEAFEIKKEFYLNSSDRDRDMIAKLKRRYNKYEDKIERRQKDIDEATKMMYKNREQEIDAIRREFYERATPHDLKMIKKILQRPLSKVKEFRH